VPHRVKPFSKCVSRRAILRGKAGITAGLGAFSLSGVTPFHFASDALAAGRPSIGTYPEGSSGSSVFIGITVPRTGTYAAQGEDELKGYQLAIEHINSGHELIKKISPKTTKGVLGKEVTSARICRAANSKCSQSHARSSGNRRSCCSTSRSKGSRRSLCATYLPHAATLPRPDSAKGGTAIYDLPVFEQQANAYTRQGTYAELSMLYPKNCTKD
jgi:hypothetical protein